jgi:hypothetical protein
MRSHAYAARAERTAAEIDFNSPLMRLAAGGIAPQKDGVMTTEGTRPSGR